MTLVKKLLDDKGQGFAEYALIIALIVAIGYPAFKALGPKIPILINALNI